MLRTPAVSLLVLGAIAAGSCGKQDAPPKPPDPQKSASQTAQQNAPSTPPGATPGATPVVAPAANSPAIAPYLDGLDALAAARYADAEKSFTQALAADEENPAFYQARGVARTLAQDFEGAIKDLQRAQKLDTSNNWETRAWVGVANKMNNHPELGFAPGIAPRSDVDYAIALSDASQAYWDSHNNGHYYDKAARKMVDTPQPYTGGFPAIAASYVRRHRAVSGGGGNITLTRLQSKVAAGQYFAALQTTEPLLEANPADVDALSVRAQCHLALGDIADARAEYTDILTRRLSAPAYLGRAKAAAAMGDTARVTKDLAEAARLDPPGAAAGRKEIDPVLAANRAPVNPQALWTQLEGQIRSGSPAATCRETASAILRATSAVRIRYDERYQDGLAALETALAAKPADPDRQIALARYLRDELDVLQEQVGPRADPVSYRVQTPADRQRELDRATQLVDTVLKAHPQHLGALALKAHMLILDNQYDEAQAIVMQALALKDNDPDLLEALAGLLRIQAVRRITEAGNLRSIKTWSVTDFNLEPPIEWTYWRLPTKEELEQAAALEQRANQLSKLAEEHLAKAAASAGATPMGFYYQATLERARGDDAAAKISMTKAVTMKPDFEKAWYELSAICTHLRDSEGATNARAMAYNLAQTTVSAELQALWFKIPHTQFKTAREVVAAALKRDPADPRIPAYLAVIDEATEKPQDALVHYRMAEALSDALLQWHGTQFAPPAAPAPNTLVPSAPDAAFAAAVRIRIAALLLDQNKPVDAAWEFKAVAALLSAMPENAAKTPLAASMLPPADIAPGIIPLAESPTSLRIRASAGEAYAAWAAAATPPQAAQDTTLAATTYRRMLVTYTLQTDTLDALQAIADLGLAELYLHRGQFTEAQAAMKDTPAVPQDFWQEMRRTESAVHAGGH